MAAPAAPMVVRKRRRPIRVVVSFDIVSSGGKSSEWMAASLASTPYPVNARTGSRPRGVEPTRLHGPIVRCVNLFIKSVRAS